MLQSSAHGQNGVDEAVLDRFLNDIFSAHEEMESARDEYMRICKEERDRIRGILLLAKDHGFSTKTLKRLVKIKFKTDELTGLKADLDPGERQDLEIVGGDKMRAWLGDFANLPLGAAAVSAADDRVQNAPVPGNNAHLLGKLRTLDPAGPPN